MNVGLQSRFMVIVSYGNDSFTFQEEIVYNNYFSLLFIIILSIGVFGDDRYIRVMYPGHVKDV